MSSKFTWIQGNTHEGLIVLNKEDLSTVGSPILQGWVLGCIKLRKLGEPTLALITLLLTVQCNVTSYLKLLSL